MDRLKEDLYRRSSSQSVKTEVLFCASGIWEENVLTHGFIADTTEAVRWVHLQADELRGEDYKTYSPSEVQKEIPWLFYLSFLGAFIKGRKRQWCEVQLERTVAGFSQIIIFFKSIHCTERKRRGRGRNWPCVRSAGLNHFQWCLSKPSQ